MKRRHKLQDCDAAMVEDVEALEVIGCRACLGYRRSGVVPQSLGLCLHFPSLSHTLNFMILLSHDIPQH